MEKMKGVLLCTLFIIVSIFCGCIGNENSKTSDQLKNANIKLDVTEESWLEDHKPDDIYKVIKTELEKEGFNVVSNEDEIYNASIIVNYYENEGIDYSRTGKHSGQIYQGTDIYCNIGLINKFGNKTFEIFICNSTSPTASNLHDSAVDNFVRDIGSGYMSKIITIEYLNETGDPYTTDFCLEMLNNSIPLVRYYSVITLWRLEDIRTIYPLIHILRSDNSEEVRAASALALAELEDKRAIEPLIEALEKDNSTKVRTNSAIALGRLNDPKALEPLKKSFESDEEDRVRGYAAVALGYLRDARALGPLNKAINNSWTLSDTRKGSEEGIYLIKSNELDREKRLSAFNKTFEYLIFSQFRDGQVCFDIDRRKVGSNNCYQTWMTIMDKKAPARNFRNTDKRDEALQDVHNQLHDRPMVLALNF